jgi:hypothetical protein
MNQTLLDYTGLTIEEVMATDVRDRAFNPEDLARNRAAPVLYSSLMLNDARTKESGWISGFFESCGKPNASQDSRHFEYPAAATEIIQRKYVADALAELASTHFA